MIHASGALRYCGESIWGNLFRTRRIDESGGRQASGSIAEGEGPLPLLYA